MSFLFSDLQTEVKSRSLLDQGGTGFDTQIKNIINTSIFRLSREANWRVLRRKATFDTEQEYSTGTGAVTVTNGSKNVTVTGATFITDNIKVGRRIDLGGSSLTYTIATITGETTLTVDKNFDGTTSSTQSYKIYGTEEYNLPIQLGRISHLWHEDYNYPFIMDYVTDEDFYRSGVSVETGNTPLCWRQWGMDNIIEQPLQASVMRIASSASGDTSKNVTIFGTVSSYPDYETITTNSSNGTTAVSGSKSFSKVERVVKDASTTGRITVDANSANTTIAVLPVGDATGSIEYKKVQIWPLPTRIFPINVLYYKDPWRLVNDSDIHELGFQFDEAIILLSVAKMNYAQGKKGEGDKFLTLYVNEVRSLKKSDADTVATWKPKLKRPLESVRSGGGPHRFLSYAQLGGSYGPAWR